MKKALLIQAALLLILSCGGKQTNAIATTDWNENDLKGNVKSISTYLYTDNGETNSYVERFDKDNRILESIAYEGGTIINQHTLYSYNNNGKISQKTYISYRHSEEGDTTNMVYTYNNSGLNTRIEEYYNGEIFDFMANEYNEQGLLISATEGEDGLKTAYAYDKNGKLTEQVAQHTLKAYEYDGNGRLASCKTYENGGIETEDNVLFLTEGYEYDEHGRLIKEFGRDAGGPSTLDYDKTLRYDEKNRLVELKITDSEGRVERHIFYTYDEKGNMVELKKLLDHSLVTEISSYIYDEQGNWIEAHYSFNGTTAKASREIEYYS